VFAVPVSPKIQTRAVALDHYKICLRSTRAELGEISYCCIWPWAAGHGHPWLPEWDTLHRSSNAPTDILLVPLCWAQVTR